MESRPFNAFSHERAKHRMAARVGHREGLRRSTTATRWRVIWLAVTLVADGLMGGAVLANLQGTPVRALVFGTLLIYDAGLFMAAAGWATFNSGVLPRWTAWIACMSAALCALSMPRGSTTLAGGDPRSSQLPTFDLVLVVGIILIRRGTPRPGLHPNDWPLGLD